MFNLEGVGSTDFDFDAFNQLASRRPYYILSLLSEYKNVLYSDIDTVWLQDPRPYFIGDYDFFAQLDGVIDGDTYIKGYLPYYCTGFLALRNTQSSFKLLQSWIGELERKLRYDQTVFNMIVHQLNINGKALSMDKFTCGVLYFEEMPQSLQKNVVMVHNNFITGINEKIKVNI